jgi:hypothetical protein
MIYFNLLFIWLSWSYNTGREFARLTRVIFLIDFFLILSFNFELIENYVL